MKKKLLIATDSFLPRWDGIARFLKEMIPYLSSRYDVTILAPHFPGRSFKMDGVQILRFPLGSYTIAGYTPAQVDKQRIRQIVLENDIIFSQTIGPIGASCLKAAQKLGIPTVAFIHSIEWELFSKSLKRFRRTVRAYTKNLAKRLYNNCKLLIVPSKTTAEYLKRNSIKTKKAIVHLGVDVDECCPPKSKEAAKIKIGIDPQKIVIGYAGRFGREKDLPTLVKAFVEISARFNNVVLLLVGGKLANNVKELEKIKNKVKIVDQTNQIVKYYQAMDIYVLPSLTETSSLTTMEAMSCGLTVIATPVGSIREYLKNKINGYLFKPGNSERIVVLLSKLIKDKQLRERLGANARDSIVKKFSWEKSAAGMNRILNQVR